ncbi:hypothetical protein MASR2M117_02550 [Paludibacter sp.]
MKKRIIFILTTFLICMLSGCEEFEKTQSDLMLPEVSTDLITNVTLKSAKVGGTVISDGGYMVEVRGVCWAETNDPTINDQTILSGEGKGEFECRLTELKSGTIYYVRAFATNKLGTKYGDTKTFKTGGLTIDDYVGTYSIKYKEAVESDYSTYSPVTIEKYTYKDGVKGLRVVGLCEGDPDFTAFGEWSESEKCIILQGGYYDDSQTLFSFEDDPELYYHAFCPVFCDESISKFYYLEGGDNNKGEAKLVMDSNGNISYTGSTPDKNSRVANGFVYLIYLESTHEAKYYYYVRWDITLTPSSSSSSAKTKQSTMPIKIQEQKNRIKKGQTAIFNSLIDIDNKVIMTLK